MKDDAALLIEGGTVKLEHIYGKHIVVKNYYRMIERLSGEKVKLKAGVGVFLVTNDDRYVEISVTDETKLKIIEEEEIEYRRAFL